MDRVTISSAIFLALITSSCSRNRDREKCYAFVVKGLIPQKGLLILRLQLF